MNPSAQSWLSFHDGNVGQGGQGGGGRDQQLLQALAEKVRQGEAGDSAAKDGQVGGRRHFLGDLVVLAGVDLVGVEVERTTNLVGERGNGGGRVVFSGKRLV